MRVRLYIVVSCFGLLAVGATLAVPQEGHLTDTNQAKSLQNLPPGAVIEQIQFAGLRRIPLDAVKSRIASREAQAFDASRIVGDLHALNRLGWFEDITAEAIEVREESAAARGAPLVKIAFHVKEYPFLSEIEYSGSKILSRQEIKKLLVDKKLAPQTGVPGNPVVLHRAAAAIQSELYSMGHPNANVAIAQEELPGGRLRARFQIHDGARLRVAHVVFSGHPEIPDATLHRQMRRVVPGAWFSGIRNKNSFTSERIEEDRESLLAYFQNHGFPEARIGTPRVTSVQALSRSTLPWPRSRMEPGLLITLPVEAGPSYEFSTIQISAGLRQKLTAKKKREPRPLETEPGRPFSAQAVESLRRAWELQIHHSPQDKSTYGVCRVRATTIFDALTHTASVALDLDQTAAYIVRRIEFRGNHRFPDRYLRRRIGLREGFAFDEYTLEAGLARLARTSYFRPFKKEDIQVELNEPEHTADLTIHLQEIGSQRVVFSGGRGQFGSTLGIAYTVFNLLNRDELLSAQIDSGPESLQMALGLAKEGFLGSRGSLTLSVFDTFLRPHLAGSVRGPFFRTHAQGVNVGWNYSLSNVDAFSIIYGLSRSVTEYSLAVPSSITGATASTLRSESSSGSVGIGWTRVASDEKISAATSVSGGWLGGSENLLKSRAEYSRILRDPLFDRKNAWAFRTTVTAAGSYAGGMPIYARFFAGDEMVRGLRPGELGPYATKATISPSSATKYSAAPAGANLIAASNIEYRHPLPHEAEAAGFFDTGSGLLLPNWLGPMRPLLIESTNGLLHASAGLEVRWTLPALGIPLRVNYSFNILRLDRSFLMPDRSFSRVHNRFAALGWSLGPLF
jgi:outer membrane protein assembly complex protein YaeT